MNTPLHTQLQQYLRRLSLRRGDGQVTADDVVAYLNKNGFNLTLNNRISLTRRVLSRPKFTAIGERQSRREEARGRRITTWMAN